MNTFELEIISPDKSEIFIVEWIKIESPTGNFIVGPDHSPLVSLLKNRGKITYKEENKKETIIDSYGGIFSVSESNAQIIFD
jgi:F0F1-type ATP synthase epsilon subunit